MKKTISEEIFFEAQKHAECIIEALDCINEVDAMYQIFGNDKHKDAFKKAPHFFTTVRQAMVYLYHIDISKLFDSDTNVLSFIKFINFLQKEGYVKREAYINYKMHYRRAKADIDAIKSRRNKILAHTDREHAFNIHTFQKEHGFNLKRVNDLLAVMLDICNSVIFYYSNADGPAELYSTIFCDDFVQLFGQESASEKLLRDSGIKKAKTIESEHD